MAKCRAVVSFTGGKDCHLALTRSLKAYEIVGLVIFHPPAKKFRAHPIEWQEAQAKALGLPLFLYCVEPVEDCYKKGYARAIRDLRKDHDIDVIITGDIDYVGTMTTNFMTEVCETHVPEVRISLPLWQQDRRTLLNEMIDRGFHIVFSCVKEPLDASWIGRMINKETIDELERLPVDLTGENGEYHTMVLYAPNCYHYKLQLVDREAFELENERGQKCRWWVCSATTRLTQLEE